MPERLTVALHGRALAVVEPAGGASATLRYLPEAVERLAGQVPLSLSLPVRPEPYEPERAMPFLAGLLPEEAVRRRLARRLRLAEGDTLGMLAAIGRECAGAVSVLPEGEPQPAGDRAAVEWLSEDELAKRLDELPLSPLGDDPEAGIRISLAGAQDKLPVVIEGERIGLPRGATPSTHILKPPSSLRTGRGNPAYPDLVENEAYCLALARAAGLPTAEAHVRAIAGQNVLVVERYDRRRDDSGAVLRMHQEDVCQALAVMPDRKYQRDGGPAAVDVVALLRSHSARAAEDVVAAVERLAFAVVTGNADAHAKNYSLLLDGGVRLAPAYDLVSTAVYPRLSVDLAMEVGGQYQGDQVTARHWAAFLAACRLDTMALRRRLATFAERLVELAPRVAAEQGGASDVVDQVVQTVRRRARSLLDLPAQRRGMD